MIDYPHWTEKETEFDPVAMAEDIEVADRVLGTFLSEFASGRLPDWPDITGTLMSAMFLLHVCSDRPHEWLWKQDIWKELTSAKGVSYSKLLPLIPVFQSLVHASISGRVSRESKERTPSPSGDNDVLF